MIVKSNLGNLSIIEKYNVATRFGTKQFLKPKVKLKFECHSNMSSYISHNPVLILYGCVV